MEEIKRNLRKIKVKREKEQTNKYKHYRNMESRVRLARKIRKIWGYTINKITLNIKSIQALSIVMIAK